MVDEVRMRWFLGGLLLAATVALAAGPPTFSETQIPTRAVPTDAGEGIDLGRVTTYLVRVCAVQPLDGGTAKLNASGTLRAYVYDPGLSRYIRYPLLDHPITSTVVCEGFPDTPNPFSAQGYKLVYADDTVGFSGQSVLADGGYQAQVRVDTCFYKDGVCN